MGISFDTYYCIVVLHHPLYHYIQLDWLYEKENTYFRY